MRLLYFALPLALAACGDRTDEGAQTVGSETAGPAQPDSEAGDRQTTPAEAAPSPEASDAPGIPEFGIPVTLQGRWGLVPADCTSTRGDAKGLLVVGATTLTFYESVARLGEIEARDDRRIRARFSFTGEGMNWTRNETLAASGDGKTLVRTETGGDEPGGPFTYTRCSN